MAISKIILNGQTQMDVTGDSVVADTLKSGETATRADGVRITGTMSAGVTDVQVAETSVVSDGVADIPVMSNSNYGVARVGDGLGMSSSGQLHINYASDSYLKAGSDLYNPVVSGKQHVSTFYALAKLAGVDLANETVTLGQYPSPALVAIQKMLGVYQAPWELIVEDTFTNASEADYIITVDQYGESFELTDAIVVFTTPQQNNASGKGDFGRVRFFFGTDSNDYRDAYFNPYTQNANAEQRTAISQVTQNNGLLEIRSRNQGGKSNTANMVIMGCNTVETGPRSAPIQLISPPLVFNKINITAVTGTAKVWVYGKRKWN